LSILSNAKTGGLFYVLINWPVVSSILASIIAAGAAWLAVVLDRRKRAAEARSIEATAAATEASTSRDLFKEVEDLRSRVVAAEDHARASDRENQVLKEDHARENQVLKDRIARLEAAIPMALVAGRVDDYASLADLFDMLSDPLVFSAPTNDGKFLWVNTAFCAALGRTRDEILALGWRKLIHPEDVGKTSFAESAAWADRVWGFVNRYVHADGTMVLLKWYCPAYKNLVTLSFVEVVTPRRKDDPKPH
jgi:PAS domain-containing protein